MIDFEVVDEPVTQSGADMLVVPAWQPAGADDDPTRTATAELGPGGDAVADTLQIDLPAELQAAGFDGAAGATLRVPTRGAVAAHTVVVAGLGVRHEASLATLRRAAAAAAAAAERTVSLATTLHLARPDGADAAAAAQAVVAGIEAGAYRFATYKSDPVPHRLERVVLHAEADTADEVRGAVAAGRVTAAAAALVRDLVNTPSEDKRPPALADRVVRELADSAVTVRVLDEHDLAAGGYGGILGVGAGSTAPPRLVELTYAPDGASRHVALVGKGITFDSGGLSLKTREGMVSMKTDMAGAATMLAAVKAAAELALPVRITAVLAIAENMPSGSATRVGDVLTIRGGKTVEVLNTDAEGRLVLADALVHASEASPDVIVDAATLTGAALVALGSRIGVLMTDDEDLAAALLAASERAGEPLWRLPVAAEQYAEELDSDIADVKNAGWKDAGTVRAGLFLQQFVADAIAWAHLDIAGVAWSAEPDVLGRKGATGVPVATLVDWLRQP